ncbi:MAG: HAD-IB family phosphatase [Limnoraphis robusta]|uniref:2-hydroxy-3-keto-5-methylthiopentenyl-1-phosphate phosphatase n=2 Tax=Limnoraphis robusta TaxID=1118279 RepID=A0A0F5YMW2_9CYAN|nr:HAD-IB family phosphatase [Limnoraphis robusta]KKD40007.1 2-hydroxy-3-keto-5-methylthiopentenyl-1-phosphate phosphatase [Limnoraphis robusta CS-951]MEA5498505.1 HAD-IB family phosphatase [Limnoraphis robusta BA-68 BA1]MEA5517474.1 HAD-IB family phosphatase [Limnoraphis robusta CCNP1315]MEA5542447.1 HAD-IB family phosphatase [Limnoraphis robusta Tam1]MEA5548954.1 HAD-IB family phosphatase [Limnoraphis robusta CCNP1324]
MKPIVFCDFDGTITAEETFVAMLKQFTPKMSAEIMPKLYNRELTLRQGVRQMLESIPSVRYPEVIAFSQSQQIRPGLVELIDFLDSQAVPFVVVSGGIRIMVETVLGELINRVAAIYAVDIDSQGEYWRVKSEFEAGTELVAKVKIMDLYESDEKVAIGDSVTDLNMALSSPLVFARDRLAQYLDHQQKSYIFWNDFFEVRDYLAQRWNR